MLELVQTYLAQAPEFGLNAFWVSQGLIGLALVSDVTSYQMKKREHVLTFFVISTVLISIHLYLLDEVIGALLVALAAVRFATNIFTTDSRIMWGFLAVAFTITLWQYETPLDILAFIATIFFTIAGFRKTDKILRQTMMCGTSLWILYNVLIFSPAAVVLETIFLTSNFVGYYRYYIRGVKT